MPTDQPNQISYDFAAMQLGKTILESRHEINRLTDIIIKLQDKFTEENQNRLKAEAALAQANERITFFEKQLNGTSS